MIRTLLLMTAVVLFAAPGDLAAQKGNNNPNQQAKARIWAALACWLGLLLPFWAARSPGAANRTTAVISKRVRIIWSSPCWPRVDERSDVGPSNHQGSFLRISPN